MSKFLLTIGIPTYNRASLLRGLLSDIFKEINYSDLRKDIQVLVVDGCSNDNTQDTVKEMKQFGEIEYFRRGRREGIDRDILKCVELSEGKYCWLFSDDDRFVPGAIAYLADLLKTTNSLSGCFCNRIACDSKMEKQIAEVNRWPGEIIKENRILSSKAECFKFIGMDFGFISSQIVNRELWQKNVEGVDFGELCDSCYLLVHIIGKMMGDAFKWLYIQKPLVKQRTENDSLLKARGVFERQNVEHNNFEKIIIQHYHKGSREYRIFFKKMVYRLPRVIANLKSQDLSYKTQFALLKLFLSKYYSYPSFWIQVFPLFFLPNIFFYLAKKFYFRYCVRRI